MENKTQYLSAGFWLPVGKANFYRYEEDEDILSTETNRPSSVFNRMFNVLSTSKGFERTFVPIHPKRRENYQDKSDPYVVYFRRSIPVKNEYLTEAGEYRKYEIQSVLIRVDSKGFYLIVAALGQGADYQALEHYISTDLVGGSFYLQRATEAQQVADKDEQAQPEKTNRNVYIEENRGILNFFQLNTILGGFYNYNLDPAFYFSHTNRGKKLERVREKYSLKSFFKKTIAHTRKFDSEMSQPQTNKLINAVMTCEQDQLAGKIIELEKRIDESNNKSKDAEDRSFEYFGSDLIRQFVRNTAINCLLPIKWNIETCRRALLKESISILHRNEEIEQLENPKNEHSSTIGKASESQIKGYILLASAKLPLIKNAQRYLKEIFKDDHNKTTLEPIADFIVSWSLLVEGIEESIFSIERAVEQTRTEKMLFELEEMRSEQEAATEIARAQDHIGWEREPDTGESITLSVQGVLLAFVVIALTVVIYIKPIFEFFIGFTYEASDLPLSIFLTPWKSSWWIFLNAVIRILLLVGLIFLYPVIYWLAIKVHKFISQTTGIQALINPEKTIKYQYELDARIDYELNETVVGELFNGQFGFSSAENGHENSLEPRKSFFQQVKDLYVKKSASPLAGFYFGRDSAPHKLIKVIRTAYRIERVSNDDALHKLHFIANILWDDKKEGDEKNKSEMKCHMIYEIFTHRIESKPRHILRELRFISTNKGVLDEVKLCDLKNLIKDEFINYWLMSESDGGKKIKSSDSMFVFISGCGDTDEPEKRAGQIETTAKTSNPT